MDDVVGNGGCIGDTKTEAALNALGDCGNHQAMQEMREWMESKLVSVNGKMVGGYVGCTTNYYDNAATKQIGTGYATGISINCQHTVGDVAMQLRGEWWRRGREDSIPESQQSEALDKLDKCLRKKGQNNPKFIPHLPWGHRSN